jgi:hypothetical protein
MSLDQQVCFDVRIIELWIGYFMYDTIQQLKKNIQQLIPQADLYNILILSSRLHTASGENIYTIMLSGIPATFLKI